MKEKPSYLLNFSASFSCVLKTNFRFLPMAVDVDGVG